jgi:hypothetical protein
MADPFLAELCGKQRAKSVPPKSNRLIADVDAASVPKRKRKPNVIMTAKRMISGLVLK